MNNVIRLSDRAAGVLAKLGNSGTSAGLAIADHLSAVAANGQDCATDRYLAREARALADEASAAAAMLGEQPAAQADPERNVAGSTPTTLDAQKAVQTIKTVLTCGQHSPCDAIDQIVLAMGAVGLDSEEVELR